MFAFDQLWNLIDIADGERLAPIALTTEHSIPKAVVHLGRSQPRFGKECHGLGQCLVTGHAVPIAAVAKDGVLVGFGSLLQVVTFENRRDGQTKSPGKLPISLVSCGHRHDGSCAIARQNIVRDPNGHQVSRQRVRGMGAGETTRHPSVSRHALSLTSSRRFHLVGLNLGTLRLCGDVEHKGVFWSEHQKAGPVQGIGSGREHLDVEAQMTFYVEHQLRSCGTSNPIPLNLFDAV